MSAIHQRSDATVTSQPPARRTRILVVDDEVTARDQCLKALTTVREYEVQTAASSRRALEKAREWQPDVIILDVVMGKNDLNGIALASRLQEDGCDAELMFLTGAKDLDTTVEGLKFADQYLNKPWESRELLARVERVLLRRAAGLSHQSVRSGLPDIDQTTKIVKPGNGRVETLTDTEMKVLLALLAGEGKPVPAATIIERVWGAIDGAGKNILQVNIRRLRLKLELNPDQPELILNIPRVGYLYVLRSRTR